MPQLLLDELNEAEYTYNHKACQQFLKEKKSFLPLKFYIKWQIADTMTWHKVGCYSKMYLKKNLMPLIKEEKFENETRNLALKA